MGRSKTYPEEVFPHDQGGGSGLCTFRPTKWSRSSWHSGSEDVGVNVDAVSSHNVRKASHLFKQANFIQQAKMFQRWMVGNEAIHKVCIAGAGQGNGCKGTSDKEPSQMHVMPRCFKPAGGNNRFPNQKVQFPKGLSGA